jgi:hypothetical protein
MGARARFLGSGLAGSGLGKAVVACSCWCCGVGGRYCQGMNFVVATMLFSLRAKILTPDELAAATAHHTTTPDFSKPLEDEGYGSDASMGSVGSAGEGEGGRLGLSCP